MIFDLPPPRPGIEMVVATRGMSKGITQTNGPQGLAKGFVRFGDLQLGGQWKNVSSSSANGEASIFANLSHKTGPVQINGGIAFKMHTRVRDERDSRAFEFNGGASRRFGALTARVNAIYSPNDLGSTGSSLFIEAGPSVALPHGWTLSAAAGRRHRGNGSDYTAFNAGIAKSISSFQLDLRYYDTARSDLGVPYRARIVASAKLGF